MKKLFINMLLLVVLVGCDAIEDMKHIFTKQKLVIEAIKEEKGWDTEVGFNINNGVLTHVTVTMDAKDIYDQKVEDLEKLVKRVVLDSFKSTPQAIYIQIAVTN